MSAYTVQLDGIDIYDPSKKEMTLLNPKVHTAVGEAGSFDFTLSPKHVFYNSVIPYGSSIEVFEDGVSIFFGRPLKPRIDIWGQKTYHCEGMLSFLNDSRPYLEESYDHITVKEFFNKLIDFHNHCQQRADRRLTVGDTSSIIGEFDCYFEVMFKDTIFDLLKRDVIGTTGGYLFARREGGVNYIDWFKEMPYTCNQIITFSMNMLDMVRQGESDVVYTGIYGIGDIDYGTSELFNIQPVWASNEIRARYGDILAYQEFPDADTEEKVQAACQKFLSEQQFESLMISCKAADLHFINQADEAFRIGMMVRILSDPQFLDVTLPIQSIDYNLDTAEKTINIGKLKKQTLTEIQRIAEDEIKNTQNQFKDIVVPSGKTPSGGTYSYYTGEDGNDYAVTVGQDGKPQSTKIFTRIAFTNVYHGSYTKNEIFDLSPYRVTGYYGDGSIEDVTSQCQYAPQDGQRLEYINGHPVFKWLVAQLESYGRKYNAQCDLHYEDLTDMSDLNNWVKNGFTNLSINCVDGVNSFEYTFKVEEYERLYFEVNVDSNSEYIFKATITASSYTENNGSGDKHTYIAVTRGKPNVDKYLDNMDGVLGMTRFYPNLSSPYSVTFTTGNLTKVYLIIDFCGVTNNETASFSISHIGLTKQT